MPLAGVAIDIRWQRGTYRDDPVVLAARARHLGDAEDVVGLKKDFKGLVAPRTQRRYRSSVPVVDPRGPAGKRWEI